MLIIAKTIACGINLLSYADATAGAVDTPPTFAIEASGTHTSEIFILRATQKESIN